MKRAILGLALAVLATLSLLNISSAAMTSKAAALAPTIVMPDDLKWAPVSGLTGVQMAVVWGDPTKSGPYIIRIQLADGATVAPHWHPDDERATVLSGMFMVGVGDKIDPSMMKALGPGAFVYIPKGVHHYAMAKGVTTVQVSGMGPFVMNPVK